MTNIEKNFLQTLKTYVLYFDKKNIKNVFLHLVLINYQILAISESTIPVLCFG